MLPRLASKLLRFGVPRQLLLFGNLSIGDDLLCTAIARELARRNKAKPWTQFDPALEAGLPTHFGDDVPRRRDVSAAIGAFLKIIWLRHRGTESPQ